MHSLAKEHGSKNYINLGQSMDSAKLEQAGTAHAAVNRKLDLEIERVRRIYALMFPDQKVLVQIVPRSLTGLEPAVELSVEMAAVLPDAQSAAPIDVLINEHIDGAPGLVFRITADTGDVVTREVVGTHTTSAHAQVVRGAFKSRLFAGIRDRLAGLMPLTYEVLKHKYVMRLAGERQSTRVTEKQVPASRDDAKHTAQPTLGKVAIVTMYWLDVGGAESFAVQCCEQLHAAGYEVHVLTAHIGTPFYEERLQKIASVYTIDRLVPAEYRARFIERFVVSAGASVIHNHHNPYLYDSLPAIRAFGLPIRIVDSVHIDERIGGGFPYISLKWSDYLDAHHVISQRLVDILKRGGVPETKILLGYLAGKIAAPAEYNIEKSLKEKRIKFIFVGRMTWQKRPLLFVAALNQIGRALKPLGIEVSAEMIGDGKYLEATKLALRRYRLENSVKLLPPGSNVEQSMKAGDVLLATSENEGITLVAFEAIRNGCLLISTDVGAQREIVPAALLANAEPAECVRDCVRIVRQLADSKEFRAKVIGELAEKVHDMDARPKADVVLARFYASA